MGADKNGGGGAELRQSVLICISSECSIFDLFICFVRYKFDFFPALLFKKKSVCSFNTHAMHVEM